MALSNKNNDLNDRSAYYYRGQAHASEQKFNEALSDFTNALKSKIGDSNIPNEELHLSLFRVELGLDNKQNALGHINEVIEIDPDYESATLVRSQMEVSFGDMKSACVDAKNGKSTSSIPELKDDLNKFKSAMLIECAKL